jgi:PAS domain S-box-containing protein
MNLKNLKIEAQLRIGFAVLLIFVIVLGAVSYMQTDDIHDQTETMYSHPLKVRRAIGSLETDIMAMRLSTRDLMMASTEYEKQVAIEAMEVAAANANIQFSLLRECYLGPPENVEDAFNAFIIWKAAREENTKLAISGEIAKVKESVSIDGKVGILRDKMLAAIHVIDTFSKNKGDALYENSVILNKSLHKKLVLLVITILLLSLLINYILLRNIRRPLKELTDATRRFHGGDLDARSPYVLKNEFGALSESFNTLAESIQVSKDIDERFAKLAELMLIEYDANKFFRTTLDALATHTGSQMAAIYLLSDDKANFEHFESIGTDNNARKSFSAFSLEGEFGAAVVSRKVHHLKDIPENTRFVFHTVSGKFIPTEIITIPIISNDEVIALVSLTSITKYTRPALQLIDEIHVTLSARIEGILAYHKIKDFSEKLSKAGSYNRSLIEASIDPLVTIGPDGKITDVNNSTAEVTGLSRQKLIGTDFANYFTDPDRAKAVYQQVFRDGIVRDFELAIRKSNGNIIPVLYNATVYRDENGKEIGVFAAARDISERKKAETEMIRLNQELIQRSENIESANRELEVQKSKLTVQSAELTEQNVELEMQKKQLDESNRLKTSFLSNMSHELRTPLNSVIALSGVLNRRLAKQIPDEEYSYLEVIERNGKHLLDLINDILDISRIEAGKEEIEISEFNAHSLIRDVVDMIHPQARQKNIELTFKPEGNELYIFNDIHKCRHILQNLIGNAVKFTDEGKVEIRAIHNDEFITIKITDTGIGIEEKHIKHIFDEFRQADGSTSRRFGGTGLGLAIVKKYTNLIGGNISVNSKPGKGSEFTLILPLTYTPENIRSNEESTNDFIPISFPKPSARLAGNTVKTILLVEDSEPAVIQIKDFLEESGYHILVARDGKEALDIIAQTIPDAMILDLMMPGIDGFEVLGTLREAEPTAHIPVLILTAKHITKEELKFLKRNNVHQLIQKGAVSRSEILEAVAKMIFPGIPEPTESVKPPRIVRKIQGKPVVLVVEDNKDNMTTVKALMGNNYTIIEALDGGSAVTMAKKHKPDLILMDIALPEMDGIEAFKKIRKDARLQNIPIIALTASAMTSDRESILAHGFNAYIAKPINDILFFKIINETLYE